MRTRRNWRNQDRLWKALSGPVRPPTAPPPIKTDAEIDAMFHIRPYVREQMKRDAARVRDRLAQPPTPRSPPMSRELRRVPKDWQHPRNERGKLQPMFDQDFASAAAEWKAGFAKWEAGERADYERGETCEFWEWDGDPPDRAYYRPAWTDAERTHFQMYETTSEGTPISPVFATIEELARWLADNGASAFGGDTATYDQWLATCRRGWAPGLVITRDAGGIKEQSGVEYMAEQGARP